MTNDPKTLSAISDTCSASLVDVGTAMLMALARISQLEPDSNYIEFMDGEL